MEDMQNTVERLAKATPETFTSEAIATFVEKAHRALSKNDPLDDAPKGGYPTDFGHATVPEHYEESWLVDLWEAIARNNQCTYVKTNKTVKGARMGNPHRVCLHVVVGRKARVEAAGLVASAVVLGIRKEARALSKQSKNRADEANHKRTVATEALTLIQELTDKAMRNEKFFQAYGVELGLAERYITDRLSGTRTVSVKRAEIAPFKVDELIAQAA